MQEVVGTGRWTYQADLGLICLPSGSNNGYVREFERLFTCGMNAVTNGFDCGLYFSDGLSV